MRVDRRAAAVALGMGLGMTITLVLLALAFPLEGFLILLFPSFLGWVLAPFLVRWVWREVRRRQEWE